MKKILAILFAALLIFVLCVMPALADPDPDLIDYDAPGVDVTSEGPEAYVETYYTEEPDPALPDAHTIPWTWTYLATIAGATAATLLITQYIKAPLDKVWKIPTRLFVYLLALVIMVVATAFTSGITLNTFLLAILNAFIVALTAYGSYEITFARSDRA